MAMATIDELLRKADDAHASTPLVRDLAARVRRRAKRRRAIRLTVAAAGGICAVVVGVWLVGTAPSPPVVKQVTHASPGRVEARLARLEEEANFHALGAQCMWAAEERVRRAQHVGKVLSAPQPLDIIAVQRDRVALMLLDHAERLRIDRNLPELSMQEYRRTVELFPDTHWGAVARQRLKEFDPGKEG
jgi:hypothetical protein